MKVNLFCMAISCFLAGLMVGVITLGDPNFVTYLALAVNSVGAVFGAKLILRGRQ